MKSHVDKATIENHEKKDVRNYFCPSIANPSHFAIPKHSDYEVEARQRPNSDLRVKSTHFDQPRKKSQTKNFSTILLLQKKAEPQPKRKEHFHSAN